MQQIWLAINKLTFDQNRWNDPVPPGRGGGLTYAQGPHVKGKHFMGACRCMMYDVRWPLIRSPETVARKLRAKVTTTKKEKKSPENWGPIVVVWRGLI